MSVDFVHLNQALDDALKCCELSVLDQDKAQTAGSVTVQDVSGLARDLGATLHSQCTKLSLAARPPKTVEAIDACLRELTKILPIFISLCFSLSPEGYGQALCDKIRNEIRYALIGLKAMVDVVSQEPILESRLTQTGILWESCTELKNLRGLCAIMTSKVEESTQMIGDAIEDLQSWAEGETDDNFDEFANSEPEDEIQNDDDKVDTVRTRDSEVDRRISMLSRIQLFLKAVNKRKVTETTSIKLMNLIYTILSSLSIEVDDLAGEIQENSDTAFIMEMEKVVVNRMEELIAATMENNKDDKWRAWVDSFKIKWLEEVPTKSKSKILLYNQPPTYQEFFNAHLKPLLPCLISGLLKDWPSSIDWCSSSDAAVEPNYEYLKQTFGDMLVSVTEAGARPVIQKTFRVFLEGMQAGRQDYARDIHIVKQFPEHNIYTCPSLFQDDWLNFQLVAQGLDDYKFVYIGGHDTRTKLHKDVVASHSWSSNLTGTKEWTLIPPNQVCNLFTFDQDEIISDIYLDDAVSRARWPNLQTVREAAIVVLQRPGETIFVPSTWYHQVRNIGPTLSINHNWINAVSLQAIVDNLVGEMDMSAEAVLDLKTDGVVDEAGFCRVVQDLTLANAGMNWSSLFDLILFRFENSRSFISAEHRPTFEYEAEVVNKVCRRWSSLTDAQYLPDVATKVTRIQQLLHERAATDLQKKRVI